MKNEQPLPIDGSISPDLALVKMSGIQIRGMESPVIVERFNVERLTYPRWNTILVELQNLILLPPSSGPIYSKAWGAILHEICSVLDHLMTEKFEKPHLKDQSIFCRITAVSDSINAEQPVL